MKIQPFRRFNKEDYNKASEWFFTFLDNINPMIDGLNPLLANQVDIDNNLLAERQTIVLKHGVPFNVTMNKLTVLPFLVRVGFANGHVGYGAITAYNADGSVTVCVYFQDAPTAAISTLLIFEP